MNARTERDFAPLTGSGRDVIEQFANCRTAPWKGPLHDAILADLIESNSCNPQAEAWLQAELPSLNLPHYEPDMI